MEHYFYDDDTTLVDNHITHSHARHTYNTTHPSLSAMFLLSPSDLGRGIRTPRHLVHTQQQRPASTQGLYNQPTNHARARARTRATITKPIYQRDDDFHELHHQKRKAYGSYLARREATTGVEDLIKRRGKLGKEGGRKSAPLPGVAGGVSSNYFCTKHHLGYTIGGGRLA